LSISDVATLLVEADLLDEIVFSYFNLPKQNNFVIDLLLEKIKNKSRDFNSLASK